MLTPVLRLSPAGRHLWFKGAFEVPSALGVRSTEAFNVFSA